MNIVLIGFMGTGKSSVAPFIADKLNMEYVEMDELIEKKAGKSIEKIFREGGELAFREHEIAVAKELENINNAVVSCGGGVVMNKIIIDYLKLNGVVVGMFADFETIFKRVAGDLPRPACNCLCKALAGRPLFKDRKASEKLYNFRRPMYEFYADKKVITDNKSIEEVAEEIVGLVIRSKRKNQRSKPS